MRGGAHRQRGGGRRAVAIVLGLLVLGAAGAGAWYFLLREGAPIQLGESEHPVPEFSFDLSRVNGTAPGGEVPSREVEAAADGIRGTLDAMYVAGFVDPEKWEGGAFPEVLEQFTETAADRASGELQQFTLGDEVAQVAFVEPALGVLKVRVLLDGDGQPVGGVATARFVADGQLDGGGPMHVIHRGTYYLLPDGGRWMISGYDVQGGVHTGPRLTGPGAAQPQPGPTT
jgi:hypothetical protein